MRMRAGGRVSPTASGVARVMGGGSHPRVLVGYLTPVAYDTRLQGGAGIWRTVVGKAHVVGGPWSLNRSSTLGRCHVLRRRQALARSTTPARSRAPGGHRALVEHLASVDRSASLR